jgi:sporulation protein YlmC with PRC-barrel domain
MTDTLGNSIGTVQDIVIDGDGKVVAVLVSVGGFLGLGETTVAIGLRHLTISSFDAEHLDVKTSLSREAIEQAARLDAEAQPPVP